MLGAAVVEWPDMIQQGRHFIPLQYPGLFMLAACMGFAVNVLAYSTIKLASSLTLKVCHGSVMIAGWGGIGICSRNAFAAAVSCIVMYTVLCKQRYQATTAGSMAVHRAIGFILVVSDKVQLVAALCISSIMSVATSRVTVFVYLSTQGFNCLHKDHCVRSNSCI